MTRFSTFAVLVPILAIGLARDASAHAHLLSATPAMGAIAAKAPTEIDLRFSEGVNLAFTGLVLTDQHKTGIPLGPPRLGPDGATTLVVPVPVPLAPGVYTVDWHALAADGHKTDGSYVFSVAP